MTVAEVLNILKYCDPDRNIYIQDIDGTAQIVTEIGDLRHLHTEDLGVTIPDDIYFMTTRQFEALIADDGPDGVAS